MSQSSEIREEHPSSNKILQESDLIFSPSSIPVSKTLSDISKRTLNISNRLRSIDSDASFIADVAAHLTGIPIVANERCGSWYVKPELKAGSAYFKSTDGHWGQWGFSLRRLNLGVLEILGGSDGGGCVIVDSTRRGKHLPDALSKTVPIWCAVMNRLLFPEHVESHGLQRLPEVISESEAWQIECRLAGYVHGARKLDLDLDGLRMKLMKPLRPFWIARSLGLLPHAVNLPRDDLILPVYLCMASEHHDFRFVDVDNSSYVQGAGDDGEHWANGLSAELYWQHQVALLKASEDQIRETIASIVAEDQCKQKVASLKSVEKAPWLQIGIYDDSIRSNGPGDVVIVCTPQMRSEHPRPRFLHLKCEEGKLGSRRLREELEKVPMFLLASLAENGKVGICCTTGKDVSIGVALAVLCVFGDEQGRLRLSQTTNVIDKAIIKKKLSWILTSFPAATPSRTTLNSVNAFLMKPT